MQDVTFYKLLTGMKQHLFAGVRWITYKKNLAVLKLITEAITGGNLIKSRLTPDAAGNRLILQPDIGHEVECIVRCLYLLSINKA